MKRLISWDEIRSACETLADHIAKAYPNNMEAFVLYGVPRGGLPIAVALSHILDSRGYRTDVATHMIEVGRYIDDVILVDDIADTGSTLAQYQKAYPKIRTATLYYRPDSLFVPDLVAVTLPKGDDTWLVFPWECENADAKRDGTIV